MSTETIHDLLPKIDEFHKALTTEARAYLQGRGINDAVINRHKLGIGKHCRQLWITIPIADAKGVPRQLILRKPPNASDKQKRYLIPKGGNAALFGANSLPAGPAFVLCCEGVLDACAAQSLGICAVSSTAGVKTFYEEWIEMFPRNNPACRVAVCFDNDPPGMKGAEDLLCRIAQTRPDLELSMIRLPEMGSGKDLTDFLKQCDGSDKKAALLSLAEPYTPKTPRDLHIEAIAAETTAETIMPAQGLINGKGYYSVMVRREGRFSPYVVTADDDFFPCTRDEWMSRGYLIDRPPMQDTICRWDQAQLVSFLNGEVPDLPLADILQLVRETLEQYIDFNDPRCFGVVSTWIVMTYFYRLFPAIGYLHLTGLKGAGKTKVMQIIALLTFNGELVTGSSTAASIVRMLHGNGATLGIDEAENLWNASDEASGSLQSALRSGYRPGIPITKCDKDEHDNLIVVRLDPYSPKAMSGIHGLEDALTSRCIEVLMLKTMNRKLLNTEIVPSSREWPELRSLIYPTTLRCMAEVHRVFSSCKLEELMARDAEIWKPLLVIADVAKDPKLKSELLSYALDQSSRRRTDESDEGIGRILCCLDDILGPEIEGFVSAEGIFQGLGKEDEFAWLLDDKERGRRGKWLNARLRRLGLWEGPAKQGKVGGNNKRGYDIRRDLLLKAAERFGVPLSHPVPSVADMAEAVI